MSLKTVLVLLFIAPFVVGAVSVFFTGRHRITPIIIDYRPVKSQGEFLDKSNDGASESEMLPVVFQDQELPKLEESPDLLETLREIEGNQGEKPMKYEVTSIPEELDRSLNDLFNAIDGNIPQETSEAITEHSPAKTESENGLEQVEHAGDNEFEQGLTLEDFEQYLEGIDEMLTHLEGAGGVIYPGDPIPIPVSEYLALRDHYGDEIMSKITTTPGIGGHGDYDCMIGKVMKKYDLTILQYGEHFIPLKGLDGEGVFLVEGMFVKPDLFYVRNYVELSGCAFFDKAAEN